jgi:hypothetical protein
MAAAMTPQHDAVVASAPPIRRASYDPVTEIAGVRRRRATSTATSTPAWAASPAMLERLGQAVSPFDSACRA